MVRRWIAAAGLIGLIAGCSMPETRMYSLSLPAGQTIPAASGAPALTVRVSAPRYLSQPFVADRTSPYELHIARYAKWESPPDEMMKAALRDRLAASGLFREVRSGNYTPEGAYLLEVQLRRFERSASAGGRVAELRFDFTLYAADGREMLHRTFETRKQLESADFPVLAQALSSVLAEGLTAVEDASAMAIAGTK